MSRWSTTWPITNRSANCLWKPAAERSSRGAPPEPREGRGAPNLDDLVCFARCHTHQRGQALRVFDEFAACAGEHDHPAVQDDRFRGEFERQTGMLLNQ